MSGDPDVTTTPQFPQIEVDIRPYLDKPMAVMALVRRALQKAGHQRQAGQFTERALASDPESLLQVAEIYVTVP